MNSNQHPTDIKVTKEFLSLQASEVLEQLHAGIRSNQSSSTMHELTLEHIGISDAGGLRTYLPEDMGEGYLDIITLSPGIFVSLVDATYFKAFRLELPAEELLKIRVICSGTMNFPEDNTQLSEGSITVQYYQADCPTSFVIQPNSLLRMVVLYALPDALKNLGITSHTLSELLDHDDKSSENTISNLSVASSQKLLHIAQDMIESRYSLPNELQPIYVRGKAQELLCETIVRAKPSVDILIAGNRIRKNDIPRFHEAKRILINNLDSAPTIERLSRLVGINKTKLKAGFRELFGETIQEYRTRVRLAEARRLLEESELQLAEIGRMTGFRHPANFTKSIKRYFGIGPLQIRKQYIASHQ